MSLVAQCLRGSAPVARSQSRIRLKARENKSGELRAAHIATVHASAGPSTPPGKQREERRAEWKTRRRQVIKVLGGAVLRGCKKTKRKLMSHFQLRAEVHSQLRVIASLFVLRIFLTCLVFCEYFDNFNKLTPYNQLQRRLGRPRQKLHYSIKPAFDDPSNQELLAKLQQLGNAKLTGDHNTINPDPAPPPAKRSKCTKAEPEAAEPTQPTEGKSKAQGNAAKAKPAPQPDRWLDRDCNAALNMQRIGESKWRPLELCYWPDQGALPAKGKEYPSLGYKRLRDKPRMAEPAAAQTLSQATRQGQRGARPRLQAAARLPRHKPTNVASHGKPKLLEKATARRTVHRVMAKKKRKGSDKHKKDPGKKQKASRSPQGKQRQERRDGWTTRRRQLTPPPYVIKVSEGAVLRGCKNTRRKLRAHLQFRAKIHYQLRVIASLLVLSIFLTCLVGYPTPGYRSATQPPAVQPPNPLMLPPYPHCPHGPLPSLPLPSLPAWSVTSTLTPSQTVAQSQSHSLTRSQSQNQSQSRNPPKGDEAPAWQPLHPQHPLALPCPSTATMLRQLKDFCKFFANPNFKTVYNQLQRRLVRPRQHRHPMLTPVFEDPSSLQDTLPLPCRMRHAVHVCRWLEQWEQPHTPPVPGHPKRSKRRGVGPRTLTCPPPFTITPMARARWFNTNKLRNKEFAFERTADTDGVSVCVHYTRPLPPPPAPPPAASRSSSSPSAAAAAAHAVGLLHISKGIAETREYMFDPDTQIGVGIDPGVTQAVSAASGVWDPATGQLMADQLRRCKLTRGQVKHASGLNNARRDTERWLAPIKPHLQHLAAASSAGTSLEANLKHITVTLATWDAVWEVYLDPKWARQRLRMYGAQDRTLEQFFKKLKEDMAEVSMERHGHAKQLVVFFGAASIGTGGGWGVDAVLCACCKVVCRPRGAGQRRGRVVLVNEHRTTRVSSAVNGKQPCEEELNKLSPTQQPRSPKPAASEPGPSTPLPAKRSKRTKAEPEAAEPTKGKGRAAKAKPAPQPGRWLDRDCNAALNMQRIGESKWRPLELCWWPDQGALPAKGKEYPGLGYKRLRDKPRMAHQQQRQPAEAQ
ncbi:hypothetical protein QJQ45_026012 [Haematococcus lacustris]|nr:hypothetical protein QJQ45_026012 [Haematococcus lacustris]